ncbi:MAG: prepilin peptidase [Candidatus Peregrinibacteria bacterium]|nr:prepilin peptidase [Candidatus Peregrinibacteria bacterium]
MQLVTASLFAVVGLALGSSGNLLLSHCTAGEKLSGRSKCRTCSTTLRTLDLIPIISFIVLRGRCRTCRSPIPLRYPLVEFLSGVLAMAAFLFVDGDIGRAILLTFALILLLLIAVMDLETGTIADALNISFLIVSIFASLAMNTLDILAPMIGIGFFGIQWMLSRGRWVGSGDIILGAGIGALLGSWEKMVLCILLAYILGAFAAAMLLLAKKKTMTSTIAFGPFLAMSGVISLFWGNVILARFI